MCFGGSETTTQTVEPFSGRYKQWYEELKPFLYNRATQPVNYAGRVSAGLNPTQQAMIGKLSGYTNNPTLAAYAGGEYVDPMKNPYVQGMAEQIRKQTAKSWGDIGNQINTAANKAGFMSSSGRLKSLADTQKGLAEAESGALANLFNTAYQQGISNMLQAGQQQQSAAQAALQGGNTQYRVENTAAQQDFQKWLQEQGLANNNISQYLYYLATGKNPTTTTTKESEGGLGSLLGTVAGGLNWNKVLGVK